MVVRWRWVFKDFANTYVAVSPMMFELAISFCERCRSLAITSVNSGGKAYLRRRISLTLVLVQGMECDKDRIFDNDAEQAE